MEAYLKNYVNGSPIGSKLVDTKSPDFIRNVHKYCVSTGSFAKDRIALELAKKIKDSQKNYYEIEIQVELKMIISLGFNEWPGEFSGSCCANLVHVLSPTDPGLYQKHYKIIDREIANRLFMAYQKFFS